MFRIRNESEPASNTLAIDVDTAELTLPTPVGLWDLAALVRDRALPREFHHCRCHVFRHRGHPNVLRFEFPLNRAIRPSEAARWLAGNRYADLVIWPDDDAKLEQPGTWTSPARHSFVPVPPASALRSSRPHVALK